MDNIELRAPKIRNIIGEIPPYIIRFGNMILIAILSILFLSAWLIPFPWFATAEVYITTGNNTIYLPVHNINIENEKRIENINLQLDAYKETSKSSIHIYIYNVDNTRDTIIEDKVYYKGMFRVENDVNISVSKTLLTGNIEIKYKDTPFLKRIGNTHK